jgi:Transposase DDE domain group 1
MRSIKVLIEPPEKIKEGKNAVKWTKLSCRRFEDNAARLQLFALAYNLANFLRQLVLPKPIKGWTLTTPRQKLIKTGAKVVPHAKYITFQLAEVAVRRQMFAGILERIGRLRLAEASGLPKKRSEGRRCASAVRRAGRCGG